ncbi:recombinase family protein [Vibrio cyclitrophicus]|nr:recombinase family protein [Vibrio cyclitrophicus]PMJ15784.1 hypothetical protein BCU28_06730 [Vibrio cyclitrophicus]
MEVIDAYIYSRVSKESQAREGEGLRRQIERAEKFIETENKINTNYRYQLVDEIVDAGLSAYYGKNTSKNGGLGAFLEAAKQGEIKEKSLLIVEAVDRLSRLHVDRSRHLFAKLKKYKIDVAITKFSLIIRHDEQLDMGVDLLLTAAFHLAHMESEQKSQRIKATFDRKRRDEILGGEKRTSVCPTWMELSSCKTDFELIPERVEVLRTMIDMKLAGYGCHRITKYLNERNITNFSGKPWRNEMVNKYLKMIQLKGELQRVEHQIIDGKTKKVPVGAPIENYYPPVIDNSTFIALQSTFPVSVKGRVGNAFPNLFRGLLRCPSCGNILSYSKTLRGYPKLRCRSRLDNQGCTQKYTRYDPIEQHLVQSLVGLDYSRLLNTSYKKLQKEISIIDGKMESLRNSILVLSDELSELEHIETIKVYGSLIDQKHNELDILSVKRDELTKVSSSYDYNAIKELDLTTVEGRQKYHEYVAKFIDYIVVQDPDSRSSATVVKFKSQKIGLLFFPFDKSSWDLSHEKILIDYYTKGEDIAGAIQRPISLSYALNRRDLLKKVSTVKPPQEPEYLADIRYLFEIKQEFKKEPDKWRSLKRKLRL